MPSISFTATILASVASVVVALPARAGSADLVAPRSECAAGTWFYSCSNGYRGCFNYDPCALPAIPVTTPAPVTTTTPAAWAPWTPQPTPWSDCPSGLTYYNCANGYKGCYGSDPCALPPAPRQPEARAWTECPAGTWFYNCANGYKGCYNRDVCSLPALTTSTTTTPAAQWTPITTTPAPKWSPVTTAPAPKWTPITTIAHTECPAGTWYYHCANGYKGCYNRDVCSLPALTSSTTTTTTTSSTTTPVPQWTPITTTKAPQWTPITTQAPKWTIITTATTTTTKAAQPTGWTECPAGTWFYNCANGNKGCFTRDVC